MMISSPSGTTDVATACPKISHPLMFLGYFVYGERWLSVQGTNVILLKKNPRLVIFFPVKSTTCHKYVFKVYDDGLKYLAVQKNRICYLQVYLKVKCLKGA